MSTDVKSAWIGALAGSVVAAAISAAVGLVAVQAESDRSSRDFFREQQQAAYAGFLTAEKAVAGAEAEILSAIYVAANQDDPLPTIIDAERAEPLRRSNNELRAALSTIELIGSTDAVASARSIANEHEGMFQLLNPPPPGGYWSASQDDASTALMTSSRFTEPLEAARDNFVQVVREDIRAG